MRLVSDCPHAEDSGAWVLSALDATEAAAFAAHLEGCERCRAEVAELQAVVDVLPMAADQLDPSPQLRRRVLDVVRDEAPEIAASHAGDDLDRRRRRRLPARLRPALAAGVAAACVAAGVVAGVALDSNSGGQTRTVAASVDRSAAPGASAALVIASDHARLHVTKLPHPSAGHVYQVWVQRAGRRPAPTDALFTTRTDGSATVDVPGRLHGVERILVTAEPDGGSTLPTSDPILTARPS